MAESWAIKGERVGLCICSTPCGCVLGLDPTAGHCGALEVHRIDAGSYGSVDLSGHLVSIATEAPGSMFAGGLRIAVYIDDRASPTQEDALVQIYTGKAGGLWTALAALTSEVKGIKRVPIEFSAGAGPAFRVGDVTSGGMEALTGADGKTPPAIRNALFNFGGELRLGKTSAKLVDPDYGWNWQLSYADASVIDLAS
jgi:hypothetical protein